MATRAQIKRAVDDKYKGALAAGRARRASGDSAVSVSYDPRLKRLHVELASGTAIAIPVCKLQGLSDAKPGRLSDIRIEGNGYGLHWPALDVDVLVPELIAGCFGTKAWMSALARHAGRRTSAAKAAAARANGRKGGRPRKVVPTKQRNAAA